MDLDLRGRRALVTGSTTGIGWAIAFELAQAGANVVVHGRDAQRTGAAAQRLRDAFPDIQVAPAHADLSDAQGCDALARACGEIDILVNNLGIFESKPFEAIADEDWQRFFEVNVMSGVRLARRLLAPMQHRNWGRIVFISSESGVCPPADMVHYGMTKSAQLSVSRGLAETCAGTGVTVNAVLPGPTRTEGVSAYFETLARQAGQTVEQCERDFFANARPTSLLRRFIEPREVAAMVAYVCSPRAAATNGTALRVDGGVVRTLV